ncbi:hypothetical protein LJC42_06985 [Eubacteriales bacterium OttesenSCG-928-K08]|nr:hypothetical protein [Eubacteriales bacterium OttesenSCG-928-K08]
MNEWEQRIDMRDIPEQYQEIAEMVGIPQLLELSRRLGGTNLYVPKHEALVRTTRDKLIRDEYNGYNTEQLALKYGLTVRWVQEILRDEPLPGQIDMAEWTRELDGMQPAG